MFSYSFKIYLDLFVHFSDGFRFAISPVIVFLVFRELLKDVERNGLSRIMIPRCI